ncbi:CKLF4-like protein [Mya arenaria]|uniref:CKLF4-like protein n=1 Tax=Mya arenaria TaxID=6604 RepID=A0ABY7ESQ3_MYAAR|nr:CKLF4-like protein [Mya arenaria]
MTLLIQGLSLLGLICVSGLSLLGLICVSVPKNEGCAYLYSSTYSYYEFVASSGFIISLVWYFLYVLAITKKLGFVRWDIAELVSNAFFIFNYLIASSVVAAKACGQGGYSAAAAFGFFCLIAYGVHEYFTVRAFLERRRDTAAGSPAAPDDESNFFSACAVKTVSPEVKVALTMGPPWDPFQDALPNSSSLDEIHLDPLDSVLSIADDVDTALSKEFVDRLDFLPLSDSVLFRSPVENGTPESLDPTDAERQDIEECDEMFDRDRLLSSSITTGLLLDMSTWLYPLSSRRTLVS